MDKKPLKKNVKVVETKKTEARHFKTINWNWIFNISALIIYILTAFYYLPIVNKNVLFKIQELSLFLPTDYFFTQHMIAPGGLLSWLGTFFTQFFYYPWLGSTIFILLALLVQLLSIKAFRIPSKLYPLTFIIPFSLLLTITQLGYMIYSIKSQGFIFSNLLGSAATLAVLWGYKKIPSTVIRAIAAGLFVFFFYPLLGFYALLGTLLCCIHELIELKNSKKSVHLIPIITGLTFIALIPYILYVYFYTQVEFGHIYTYALPGILFIKEEIGFWSPYIVIIAFLLLFSFIKFSNAKKENTRVIKFSVAFTFLLTFFAFCHYSFNDDNFQTETAMNLAISDNRWEDVLKLAKQQKDEPTRLIVMQTNLALQKLNRGGDEMFSYNNGSKEMKTPWPARLIVLAGKQMYYQYGQANYCYHWCMEDMVERGMKVEYLKYMVKCALIKGELNLAKKYNDVLMQTLFYKKWALEYQKYIDNPMSMLSNEELNSLRPLTAFNDALEGNSDVLELDLLNDFAYSDCVTPAMLDLSLQSTLILRNTGLFWPRFFLYAQTHSRIPRYYQEAALLYSYYEKGIDVSKIKFNKNIVENFNQFIFSTKQNYNSSNSVNKQVFTSFKDTFWFYYFFMKDLKIH